MYVGIPVSQLRKLRLRELTCLPKTPPRTDGHIQLCLWVLEPPPLPQRWGPHVLCLLGRYAQSQSHPALPVAVGTFRCSRFPLRQEAEARGSRDGSLTGDRQGLKLPLFISCTHTSYRGTRKLTIASALEVLSARGSWCCISPQDPTPPGPTPRGTAVLGGRALRVQKVAPRTGDRSNICSRAGPEVTLQPPHARAGFCGYRVLP